MQQGHSEAWQSSFKVTKVWITSHSLGDESLHQLAILEPEAPDDTNEN